MPKRIWSLVACRVEAAKYKKRSDFSRASGGAYNKALKEGWLGEICAHMEKVRNKPYSYQEVASEAKKYSYRSEFKEKAYGYYQRARRQKWLDKVCSHMQARTDGRLHCVYAIINERENKAYIGITRQNLYKRLRDHKSKRSKTNAKQIVHLQDTKMKQLTDYIYTGVQVVQFAEQKFIDIYRQSGWEILNSMKAVGSLGYSETIWTYEKLLEEASKYESRKQFADESASAYRIALAHARHAEIFATLPLVLQYWDSDSVKEAALEFCSRSAFKEAYPTAYQWALRNNCMDDICGHMEPQNITWDLGLVLKAASECTTKTDFQNRFSGAYKWANANGVYDVVTSHMPELQHSWTYEELVEVAKCYSYRADFSAGEPNAYVAAINKKILDEICSHMGKGHKKPKKWTYERLEELASEFSTRSEFKLKYPGAYTQARKTEVLDDICRHMENVRRSWDFESCKAEANKYTSRSKFKDACSGGYVRARKEGWLDTICAHMK